MKTTQYWLLLLITLGSIVAVWMQGPIPQDINYHNFADQRTLLGIPHFWDEMSNLPMFFLGIYGFQLAFKNFSTRPDFTAKWMPVVLAFGVFITSFGSAYYHYAPDNNTLFWDRLPMTLMFMPIFSLIIYDNLGPVWGKWAFLISVPLGVFSIAYWSYTESINQGDLRLYALVQFYPMVIAPAILLMSPQKKSYSRYFWLVLAWYIVAKLFEHFDVKVFEMTGFWSGHTIKHLLGAVSLYYLLKLVKEWDLGVFATK